MSDAEPGAPAPAWLAELRGELAAARASGVDFEAAWDRAAPLVGAGWPEAMLATKGAWRRAYDRRPAIGAEPALRRIATTREHAD